MTLPNRTSSSSCFILQDVLETSTIELLSEDEGVDLIQDDSGFIKRFKLSSSGLRCPNSIRRARIEQWASAALSNMTFKPGRLWFHMWQKGWWRESASYARLYVFSWIWGFRNFPMCSVSLYTDWACLLPKNYVSPARTRKVHESHPKENSRRKATDNAWYPCDGNRNTSLLLSGFSKLLTIDFLKDRLQLELSFIHPPFDAWNAGCVVVGWKEREKEKGRATVPRKGKPFRRDHTWFQKHLVILVLGGHRWICSQMSQVRSRCFLFFLSLFCKLHICSCQAFFGKFMSTWQVFHMMQLF